LIHEGYFAPLDVKTDVFENVLASFVIKTYMLNANAGEEVLFLRHFQLSWISDSDSRPSNLSKKTVGFS
jgi:hypothetical protein